VRYAFFLLLSLAAAGCNRTPYDSLIVIQIQDRNGLVETISTPDRIANYEAVDFLSPQPYKKVLRSFKKEGKNHSKVTTYHPNGMIAQYLEAEEMRAHGAFREWFPNGQLKIEAYVIGGTADVTGGAQQDWLFEETSRVWDDQGRPVAEISYKKGELEGPSVYYFPTGGIEKQLPFVKNELEGEALEFTADGQIKSRTHYKKGLKEGTHISFFDNAQAAMVEDYTEGLLRKGTYYNPEGKQISEVDNGGGFQALFEKNALTLVEFRMGKPNGWVKKYTPTGELHRSYILKNGKKHGEEVEFYLASEIDQPSDKPLPKLSVNWNENAIHGFVKTWYNNGMRQSEREYCRNQKQGPALAWYRDGALMLVEEYEKDNLIKGQYYKINNKEPVSTIVNGNGTASLYDETGSFIRKIVYSKGKPVDLED
jgi:antitoxin component YwqK of YwqJK toxin-antitoxin module